MKQEKIGKCHLCEGEVVVTVYDPPKKIEDGWLLDTYDCDVCNIEQEHCIKYKKDIED